jgi:hypothetical protein
MADKISGVGAGVQTSPRTRGRAKLPSGEFPLGESRPARCAAETLVCARLREALRGTAGVSSRVSLALARGRREVRA